MHYQFILILKQINNQAPYPQTHGDQLVDICAYHNGSRPPLSRHPPYDYVLSVHSL